ncbi:MAG: hypothetical protein A4E65_01577 [Syntrophorhabdus sp. PtaU1.Bin153]|nr:MAG: hypothetical protein A4E65_01577 [Syntrophorhabdus sp. PtaU1.Bin153]
MLIQGLENVIAALVGLRSRGLTMNKLDSVEQEMNENITTLAETRELHEHLKEELAEIDRKVDEILDHLEDLEGDAAESVRQELMDEKDRKVDEIAEKQTTIETKEQELNEKLQQIEESLSERNDALNKVQELGKAADIDVSDAMSDINEEIGRLEEDKRAILESLRR